MKRDNQILLEEKEKVTSMNPKVTCDQRIFEDLRRYRQSDAEKDRADRFRERTTLLGESAAD
jgi:hypothetical protein